MFCHHPRLPAIVQSGRLSPKSIRHQYPPAQPLTLHCIKPDCNATLYFSGYITPKVALKPKCNHMCVLQSTKVFQSVFQYSKVYQIVHKSTKVYQSCSVHPIMRHYFRCWFEVTGVTITGFSTHPPPHDECGCIN